MSEIKTAADLRGFLADVLEDIRAGKVDPAKAAAISNVAGQINKSLAIEVGAALQLRRLGEDQLDAVSLSLAEENRLIEDRGMEWCEQCEKRVNATKAKGCLDKFCKAKTLFP